MAQKKSKVGEGGPLFVLCLALVVATLLAFGWLVAAWLYREVAYRDTGDDPRSAIRLSAREASMLDELRHELEEVREETDSILRRGAAVPRRKDGYFYERGLGMELNVHLRDAVERGRHLEERIAEIEPIPQERFATWSERRSKLSGSRFAIAWFVVALVVFLAWQPWWMVFGGMPLALLVHFFTPDGLDNLEEWQLLVYTASVWSTWLSFGVYHLRRYSVAKSNEKLLDDGEAGESWVQSLRKRLSQVLR